MGIGGGGGGVGAGGGGSFMGPNHERHVAPH